MVAKKVDRGERRYTPAEYLALERAAEYKSEYIDGYIVAMSGASKEHGKIAFNCGGQIYNQLHDQPCDAFLGDMRVHIPATGRYTYPDVVVACGDAQYEDEDLDTLLTPAVVIEVLSPSTEREDRGNKSFGYRSIPSLQEYLLIAQDRVSVEHFVRHNGNWLFTEYTDLDGIVALPSINCTLALREVYRRVQFPADHAPPIEPNNAGAIDA